MRTLFSILFVGLLSLPALLGPAPWNAKRVSGQVLKTAPGWQPRALLESDYVDAWRRYLSDRIGRLPQLTSIKRQLDYRLFAMSDERDVHVGRNGWLFERTSMEMYANMNCAQHEKIQDLFQTLQTLSELMRISDRTLIVSITPDKSTIYPEHIGTLPHNRTCNTNAYQLWLEAIDRSKMDGFVRLDVPLLAAKAKSIPIHHKKSTALTPQGASIVSNILLQAMLDSNPRPPENDDLAARMLGQDANDRRSDSGMTKGHVSSVLIYGGQPAGRLLSRMARHFQRVDWIDTLQIPSESHQEHLTDYDIILCLIDESDITEVRIDVDRWCTMLGVDRLAETRKSVSPNTIKAGPKISIDRKTNPIRIKSMGGDAYFSLPALPGSDQARSRLIKMVISSPQAETLTWKNRFGAALTAPRHLRPGENSVYLPLARGPSVRIDINPGQRTGIYYLSSVEVLEFKRSTVDSAMWMNAQHPSQDTVVVTDPEEESHRPQVPSHPKPGDAQKESSISIALKDFEDGRIFQRSGTSADIVISGTYNGHVDAIEAQVVDADTQTTLVPWTIIDTAPAQGIFMGILSEVPQGGWYRLAVRFRDHRDVMDTGSARWAVGILVGCIGQSNMKEWFYSGSDMTPHSLAGLHREGRWHPESLEGNGATAFANRLIGRLAVPVGLLDYAVNGSGLCAEADWGKGYWADGSDRSIYRRWIDAVANAGGALEYIIWMQGEADAARGTISQRQYQKTLTDFIDLKVRNDILNGSMHSHLPFLVIGMVKRPVGKDAPHQAIRRALQAATELSPHCYLAATTLDLENQGRQHLSPDAYTALGLRAAQTILYLLEEETYYRGPSISGGLRREPAAVELYLQHRGGVDFQPISGITGWQVLSGLKEVPIKEVLRLDPRTLRILLAEPTKGPLRLRYLYGAMPDTRRPIRDNSPMELPLEPFEQTIP